MPDILQNSPMKADAARPFSAVSTPEELNQWWTASCAGRPYFLHGVRLLVEQGADVNARTIPGQTTGAFMRDVRTKGETTLHRRAAYRDADTIAFLLEHGADREARMAIHP